MKKVTVWIPDLTDDMLILLRSLSIRELHDYCNDFVVEASSKIIINILTTLNIDHDLLEDVNLESCEDLDWTIERIKNVRDDIIKELSLADGFVRFNMDNYDE